MMRMVIAPGEPIDRSWVSIRSHVVLFARPLPMTWMEVDPDGDLPEPGHAYLRWYRYPSWSVTLPFYVVEGLRDIPRGYVMPGWVQGEWLEQSCLTCGHVQFGNFHICPYVEES